MMVELCLVVLNLFGMPDEFLPFFVGKGDINNCYREENYFINYLHSINIHLIITRIINNFTNGH